jgi:DNA-directed RNA polymerase specialized sigma24 family protein
VYREGWSFDEACQILWTNYKVKETRQELEEIWKQLPPRTPSRGPMGEEGEVQDLPDPQLSPEDRLLIKEIQTSLERIKPALKKALDRLDPDDRLFIMMVVVSGISIADAAKILCKEQKPLYRLLKKILRHLREDLEREEAGEK